MHKPPLHLVLLENYPIYEQLLLEEALMRSDTRDFCLINRGSPPALVMGISAKLEEVIDLTLLEQPSPTRVPIIKRFSGGGTVVIDEDTLFISLIFHQKSLSLPLYPEPLMRFTESLFQQSFEIPNFHLRENDFAIGEKKCGGNAQYIQKERWLQHTSFLWDFQESRMSLLKLPPKRPHYRQDRSHGEFLTKLKNHLPNKEEIEKRLVSKLHTQFSLLPLSPQEILEISQRPCRRATFLL